MNRNNTIIPIKRVGRRASLWLSLSLLVFAAQLTAHGGFEHVIGTVVKVENNVMTVKTAKGNVDVRLNEKTEITRNDQKAEAADLKPGTRVVVDVPEGARRRLRIRSRWASAGAERRIVTARKSRATSSWDLAWVRLRAVSRAAGHLDRTSTSRQAPSERGLSDAVSGWQLGMPPYPFRDVA